MSRIVAIDPKKNQLWCSMTVPVRQIVCVAVYPSPLMLDAFFSMLKRQGKTLIVYEDCYMASNRKTFGQLVALKERTQEAAWKAGLRFELVSPTTWQGALLHGAGESARKVQRVEGKFRAFQLINKMVGYPIQHEDVCDSLCIYLHTMQKKYKKFLDLTYAKLTPADKRITMNAKRKG